MGSRTLAGLGAILLIAACSPARSPTPVITAPVAIETPESTLPSASPQPSEEATGERSPDGIPASIDGRPVLRGDGALDFADAQADSSAFLVGGWVTFLPGPRFCPLIPTDEAEWWTRDCLRAQFTDVAGTVDKALTDAVTFRFVFEGLRTGPVIAEVHVHDPRAGDCGAARAACDAMIVVERTVWTGDDATAHGPLTPVAVADLLTTAQGSRDMRAWGEDSGFKDCGSELPSAQLYTVDSGNDRTPGVTLVELEPSIDAMQRAAPANAIECESTAVANGVATSTDHRWLVVANAALLVRTQGEPTPEDRAFLDRLRLGLEELAANE